MKEGEAGSLIEGMGNAAFENSSFLEIQTPAK